MVELDHDLDAAVRKILEASHRELAEALDDEAERIHGAAYAAWPVKTGKSRSALNHGLRVMGMRRLEGFVGSDSPYAYYIRGRRQNGKRTWNELVAKPMKRASKRLAKELAPQIARAANREV